MFGDSYIFIVSACIFTKRLSIYCSWIDIAQAPSPKLKMSSFIAMSHLDLFLRKKIQTKRFGKQSTSSIFNPEDAIILLWLFSVETEGCLF